MRPFVRSTIAQSIYRARQEEQAGRSTNHGRGSFHEPTLRSEVGHGWQQLPNEMRNLDRVANGMGDHRQR
jgi:hypothetical protein